MSYPTIEREDFLEELLKRKEFYSLKADSARNFRDPPESKYDTLSGKYLKVHSHQLFVRNFINPNTSYKRLHLMHATGCHAAGTKILMFDGTIKNVEDVELGDQLMGDDNMPRNVLRLIRNVEKMYRVIPTKGEVFICNENHILSLKCNNKRKVTYRKVIDISIADYLKKDKTFKHTHKLFRVPVEFPERPVEIDPYMIGYWLGDGNSYGPEITCADQPIINYFTQEVPKFGAYIQYKSQYDYRITTGNHGGEKGCNRFLATLQKYDLIKNKHIPYDYKCNSRENRLKLLAGLIDSDGSYDDRGKGYDFIQKNERLLDDVVYLCRSLGFAAYKQPCIKKCTNSPNPNHQDTYYRIFISGDVDQIPVLLDRKKAGKRQHNKDVLSVGFTLEELPEDNYYGFELDSNHRYLLGCFTVTHNTGKTLAAVSIAQEFIKVYKKLYTSASAKLQASRRNHPELDRSTPTVFVLGFGGTKGAFVRELMRYPEFGFISISEKEELVKREKLSKAGLPDDIKNYKEYYSYIKKRITNKAKGGFYKFFGYDEFVNRLFHSEEVKLTDLEALANQKSKTGENVTLEDIIYEQINNGKIQVNHQLMAMFENSLLICDEIHNTYNMNIKNNRGVAIQFILDSVKSLRFVSMSATPFNNSPTEVVELVNYLVPTEEKITKREYFINNRTLAPGKLQELGRITKGRISFIQDVNVKYFPRRIMLGDDIALPKDVANFREGDHIPYLKFIPCEMSEYHQKTYNIHVTTQNENVTENISELNHELNSENNIHGHDTESGEKHTEPEEILDELEEEPAGYQTSGHKIPTDGYSIYDMVFPNPDADDYGIFKSSEVRNKISLSSSDWKLKNKISIKKYSAINSIITGEFLLGKNIGKYSTKFKTLLDTINQIISEFGSEPTNCQKIMVYHDRVKMSGVLLIQELLKMNNFLDEYSEPVDSTICCICGKSLESHAKNKPSHEYKPARFVVAHSDVDKSTMEQSLAKFNSPDNANGHNYMILVGSKIIKESYDFKDIQHLIITSLPINIPTLIQVFGRCIRKGSHINLPPEHRVVNIRILISTVNNSVGNPDPISPEMYRYVDKISDYIVIQNIEREINRNAIDADIHRDIIMPPDLYKQYFPKGNEYPPLDSIGNLYFEPSTKLPSYKLHEVNSSTFTAYKHYEEEIKTISYVIKRLFMMEPVWTYDDLWSAVREPPVGIETNPKLFSEQNFIIALHNLLSRATNIMSMDKQQIEMTETFMIERLFDSNERYIWFKGMRHKIEQIGKYYIMFPVTDLPSNPLNIVYAEYLEHVRDKERAMIKQLAEPNDRVLVDVETYLRPLVKRPGIRINVDNFVKESRAGANYNAKKQYLLEKYSADVNVYDFLSEFSAQFQMNFTEESIMNEIVNPNESSVYNKIIDLLDKFGVIIYMKELRKYKDLAKQFKNGLPDLPDNTPIGYETTKTIRLFDPASNKITTDIIKQGKWSEVSKIAMNRHVAYKENDIIIGYLESAEDHMKFKLRKPTQKIKEDVAREVEYRRSTRPVVEGSTARTTVGDTRLIERGIVCSTKNKYELLKIIAQLGISASQLQKGEKKIKKLCEIIKDKLMRNEIKERQRDSRYKYLYSWWNEPVALSL
jgi:hypothetical protein